MNHRRLPALVSAVAVLVALSASHVHATPRSTHGHSAPTTPNPPRSAAACSLVGTWADGRASFTFDGQGTFVVRPNPVSTVHGSFTYEGGRVRMTNTSFESSLPGFQACVGVVGTYSVTFDPSCASFTLGLVEDSCPQRAAGANGATMRKQ